MKMKWQHAALIAAFLFAAVSALLAVRSYEQTLAHGRIVLLRLAPVDPRSLMQGDYMALRFEIDRDLPSRYKNGGAMLRNGGAMPRYAYLSLDNESRASFKAAGDSLTPPQEGLVAVLIRTHNGNPSIGPNAFFFQEGTAAVYEQARWGEFRINNSGKALLAYLRDENLVRLGENIR